MEVLYITVPFTIFQAIYLVALIKKGTSMPLAPICPAGNAPIAAAFFFDISEGSAGQFCVSVTTSGFLGCIYLVYL